MSYPGDFYGSLAKAQSLAGTDAASNITDEMLETVDNFIDLNINTDKFRESAAIEYHDIEDTSTRSLILKHFPIISVSELIDNSQSTQTPRTISSDEYVYDSDTGILTLLDADETIINDDARIGFNFTKGTKSVKVSYSYGYETVPSDIATIANLLAAKWAKTIYRQEQFGGIKSVKMGNYQQTNDVDLKGILGELGVLLDTMIDNAKIKYHRGV